MVVVPKKWPGCQTDNFMMTERNECYRRCQQEAIRKNLPTDQQSGVWNNACIDRCQRYVNTLAYWNGWNTEQHKRFIRRGVLWNTNEFSAEQKRSL